MNGQFLSLKTGSNSEIDTGNVNSEMLKRINISIGENCRISLKSIHALNQTIEIHMGDNCVFELGEGQKFNGTCSFNLLESSRLIIGSDCLWAKGAMYTGDYHSIFDVSKGLRINQNEDINIGNKVWFGMDFLVLKGAKVGSNSVIGARSVVTSGIYPNNVVLAGCPAKVVKENITWEI